MTYAYLEKLNKPSLLDETVSTLSAYEEIDKNIRRAGTESQMSMAERIQLYTQLKELQAKGGLSEKYSKGLTALENGLSQLEVTMSSATEKGKVVHLYDMNGNRVTMKQLLDNPNATYKWECKGSFLEAPANYLDSNHAAKEGVSYSMYHNCGESKTHTFEASGTTILGDILTEKNKNSSALFYLDYSPNIFR